MFSNINIIEALQWGGLLLLGAGLAYYRTNAKLQQYVARLITAAEAKYTATKSGGAKFAFVCSQIYKLVPVPLRVIITQQMIEQIVQGTFNSMAAYAKTQLDRLVDTAIPDTVHTEDK